MSFKEFGDEGEDKEFFLKKNSKYLTILLKSWAKNDT